MFSGHCQCVSAEQHSILCAKDDASLPLKSKDEIKKSAEHPASYAPDLRSIPEEMRRLTRWVYWRWVRVRDEWTKVLYNPKTDRRAKTDDPETWGTWAEIIDGSASIYDGIGFIICEEDGYCGIDLDAAIDLITGKLKPWAQEKVKKLASRTEISPSLTGIKILVKGKKPGDRCKKSYEDGEVEMYTRTRFFTITGMLWPDCPETIEERTAEIGEVYEEVFGKEEPRQSGKSSGHQYHNTSRSFSDEKIVEKARGALNGPKFSRLMAGDTSDYGDDDSRADSALCAMLAFWTRDTDQIDRIFRSSGLMRSKWDEARGEQTYGARTIGNACEVVSETYGGSWGSVRFGFSTNGHGGGGTGGDPGGSEESEDNKVHLTDVGNAQRILRRHGGDMLYCQPWRQFLVWDGKRFAIDETGEAVRRAKDTARQLYRWAAKKIADLGDAGDDEERKEQLAALNKVLKHSINWESAPRINASLEMLRSEVPIIPDYMDKDPWLLNVNNGTIDLRTGELLKHNRGDVITKLSPLDYDPHAECPKWLKCLDTWMGGNESLTAYLRRAIGYSLSADVSEQVLFFLFGDGSNGKSTFLNVLREMLGDYAWQAVPELLMQKKGESHSTERADLFGRRFVTTAETEDGKRLAEALVKQVTGGEPLTARRVFKDNFQILPTWKLFLASNHKPAIRGTDLGIWRRIRIIPFTVTIPEEDKDPDLVEHLRSERPGILAWSVRGFLEWHEHGLMEPREVMVATEEYRKEMDSVGSFIEECCTVMDGLEVKASVMLERYREFSGDRNFARQTLQKRLHEKGFSSHRKKTGYFYQGIGINASIEMEDTCDEGDF